MRELKPWNAHRLEVTEGHLALLHRSNWRYEEGEFGAASMDTKRPYGNSDVLGDIAEIVEPDKNWSRDKDDVEDGEVWGDLEDDENRERFYRIHHEMVLVMDILSETLQLGAGTYEKEDGFSSPWRKVS